MNLLQQILFYIAIALGGVIALLLAVTIYANAIQRAWKHFWISLAGFIYTVAMLYGSLTR